MDKKLILFVCTGNICRSPMAEYLFRAHLTSRPDWKVASAGVATVNGAPPSRFATEAVAEMGIDLRFHKSRMITGGLMDDTTLVVVMTEGHREQVCAAFPDAEDRVHLLKSFTSSPGDILDPIGLSFDVYRSVRDEIAEALWDLDRHIAKLDSMEKE